MSLTEGARKRMEQLAGRAPKLEPYERGELHALLLSRPSSEERATLEKALGGEKAARAEVPAAYAEGLKKAQAYAAGGTARGYTVNGKR